MLIYLRTLYHNMLKISIYFFQDVVIFLFSLGKIKREGAIEMKKKNNDHVIFSEEMSDLDSGHIACATDCTGLIPFAPESREERKSYKSIYHYSPDVETRENEIKH